ncbi:MAG: hypothetical protein GX879_03670 [Bacteroidales bacterium]|nr:hypothetical protein [Bacteroidales bacterium]
MRYKVFISLAIILAISTNIFAQNTKKDNEPIDMGDMTIYNEYTPSIKDANRIQPIPVIVDTSVVQSKFEYSIFSNQFPTRYTPAPIQAADIKPEPLSPLNNGWIKLGIGNYLSPYIEASYHNLRSKDYSIGAYAKHHSAHGKISNEIKQKVYAGYNNNEVKLYAKKFMSKSTFFSNITYDYRENFYYGVNPDLFQATDIPLTRNEQKKQRFNLIGVNLGLNSNNITKKALNYDIILDYKFLNAIDSTNQNYLGIAMNFNKDAKKVNIGSDLDFKLYKTNFIDSANIIPSIKPYVQLNSSQWQIKLGVNGTARFCGDSASYHLYPDVTVQHNVSNTIIPYFSFKGNLQFNDLQAIGFENPFSVNRLMAEPTNYAQIIDLGLKGNINRKVRFNIKANYSKIDNMYFYVIDTTSEFQNEFNLVYSNIERFSGYGEILIEPMDKLSVLLNGHYYYYHYIKSEDKAWHMPNFDISLFARYQFNKELNLSAGVYTYGTRWTKNLNAAAQDDHNKLKPIVDISLKAEYAFAANFSSFLALNNLIGQKYYIWDGYRAHGFNFMLGLNYSF